MKLPILAISVAFAGGILLASSSPGLSHVPARVFLAAAALLLIAGCGLLRWRRLFAAWLLGVLAWTSLGAAAVRLEVASIPHNLASALIASGRIDSSVALRWRGTLREDPLPLPWGRRYLIDLDEVELPSGPVSVTGGLRLTLYLNAGEPLPPLAARAGDLVEVLTKARVPRNFANPGEFDLRAFLARQNIDVQGTLRNDALLTVLGSPRKSLSSRLARLRGRFLAELDSMFRLRPDLAAIARAMLLGDRSFVEHDRVVEFQTTGVYHVLVIAGLHVAALAAFFLWLGRRLRLSSAWRTVLTLAALAAYVGIVEDRPPIFRAALMVAIYLLSRMLFRRAELLNVTALAALVILAARPSEISDPSFLLSFAAIGSIAAFGAPWLERTSEVYRRGLRHLTDVTRDAAHPPRVIQFRMDLRDASVWIAGHLHHTLRRFSDSLLAYPAAAALYAWDLVAISLVIQLGMLPFLAAYFHRVTLAGPLANVPAYLLTAVIVPLGFLTLTASLISRDLACLLASFLGAALSALEKTVDWFAHWHWLSYRIPSPPVWLLVAFLLTAAAAAATFRMRSRIWRMISVAALLLLAGIAAADPFPPSLARGQLELTVLDVGQGDSLFVAFPDGRTMLIDGGGLSGTFDSGGMQSGIDTGEEVVSPYLWSRNLKTLDIVALTHADHDHIGGLPAVLSNFRVQQLWVGRDFDTSAYRDLLELARSRGVRVVHVTTGANFNWDTANCRVLWPATTALEQGERNNDSVVMRMRDGAVGLILTGDIERASEKSILAEGGDLAADFLKVAHHGSKTSTTEDFLSAVHPKFAAISVGEDNSFGHPSPEVLDRLRSSGVAVFRTDRDGAITAVTDGRTIRVTTFLHANP